MQTWALIFRHLLNTHLSEQGILYRARVCAEDPSQLLSDFIKDQLSHYYCLCRDNDDHVKLWTSLRII